MSGQDNANKSTSESKPLNRRNMLLAGTTLAAASALSSAASVETAVAQAQQAAPGAKPNILVIMGDDVGWFNIGAYHQGIMSGKTPSLDKLAADGMRLTEYYAEGMCTAVRASFITGEIAPGSGLPPLG